MVTIPTLMIFCHFTKGSNFGDFLIASLGEEALPKPSAYKRNICKELTRAMRRWGGAK